MRGGERREVRKEKEREKKEEKSGRKRKGWGGQPVMRRWRRSEGRIARSITLKEWQNEEEMEETRKDVSLTDGGRRRQRLLL